MEIPEAEIRELTHFVSEFVKESDRAAVILGAAKIDTQLFQILQKVLIANPAGTDDLLDNERPLSSFSSRINMVYRLGLIDAELTRALHLIRRIRNSCAHELSGVSLTSGPHRDRIRELVAPLKHVSQFAELKNSFKGMAEIDEPAADFRMTVAIIMLRLNQVFHECQTLPAMNAIPLLPPHLKKPIEKTEEKSIQNESGSTKDVGT